MYIQINILSVLVYTALLFLLACDDTPPLNPVFYFWNLVGFSLRYGSNENIFLFLFLGITKKKGARIPEIHRRSRKPISFCSSASRRGNIRRWCRKTIGKCHDSATRPAGHCTQQERDNIQIRNKVKICANSPLRCQRRSRWYWWRLKCIEHRRCIECTNNTF